MVLQGAQQQAALGRYEIVGPLATGGMAEVLLGRVRGPSGFERPVVLKRILPHYSRIPDFRQMFLDEARIVANVRHRNVVAVHELGEDDGELYLVMEYLEGESLSSVLRGIRKHRRAMPLRLGAHVVAEAAAGLHAAHELTRPDGVSLEVVHRDVSPHNLFVLYDGQVKVIDFGIAKGKSSSSVTQTGHVKGKFAYMAPEQCRAEQLDRRADVFALGIVLYEVTTGHRLFDRDNDLLILRAVTEDPIKLPSAVVAGYPADLEVIVMKALARDRNDRYPSGAVMRRDLLAWIRAQPVDDSPEEELSAVMGWLFADRIAEKKAALLAIQGGSAVASIPVGDPSLRSLLDPKSPAARERSGSASNSGVHTPYAVVQTSQLTPSHASGAGALVPRDPRDPGATVSRPRGPLVVGLALLTAAAIGAAIYVGIRPPRASGGGATAATSEPTAAPTATLIGVELTSVPPDAEVRIGGATSGRTPVRVELPRGTDAVAIELHKDGFIVAHETVVPDQDQRLSVRLAMSGPAAVSADAPGAPSAATVAAPSTSASAAPSAEAPPLGPTPNPKNPPKNPPKKTPPPKKPDGGFTRFD